MAYRIKLQNFEGPLDLLLFLLKKNELNIYDIPIALITQQYLQYIQIMQTLDLEVASEFIVMAATLIRIKSKLLLPKPDIEEELEEIDPRQELIERLIEYRKYKQIALELSTREDKYCKLHKRENYQFDFLEDEEQSLDSSQVTLFDLISAFREVTLRYENQPIHQIHTPSISVDEQYEFIKTLINSRDQLSFSELMDEVHLKTRAVLVATFIAMLELIKNSIIQIRQSKPFSEIWIFGISSNN